MREKIDFGLQGGHKAAWMSDAGVLRPKIGGDRLALSS
jgi:hypothetical protein